MKNDKMVLIAYHMLSSSTCAYIEWLVNRLKMTANEIEYKDVHLVMFSIDDNEPTSQIALHIIGVFFFLLTDKSYRVQLSTQGLFYPVAGYRNIWV
jgi:hypothetical protein